MLCSEALDPLTLVRCYPIGYISMLDGGKNDEKIIAIPFTDPGYNGHRELTDLPAHIFDEMAHFFAVYKALEGKEAVPGTSMAGLPLWRSSSGPLTTMWRASAVKTRFHEILRAFALPLFPIL